MESIGIVGCGFVGKAIYNGMSPNFKIYMYDKFKEGYNSLEEVCKNCNIIFVCVPTPMKNDGSQDLSNMEDCIEDISKVAKLGTILILKSTILPGTTRYFSEKYPNFEFFFNPEFLTERNADFDFINQSRILIGIKNIFCKETNIVEDMYRLRFPHTPIHWCSYEEAELTKYVCNCFFSAKLSFMNEVKEVCDKIGVKYENVRKMFLGDFRIANSHTEVPGPDGHAGFGGKCFPKDLKSFTIFGKNLGLPMSMFTATQTVNERVREYKDWENIVGATSENNYGKEK